MAFDKIKPEFLKRLDHYLLVHYPAIWHSKIIWVAFYSLSLFGLFYMFGDHFDQEVDNTMQHYFYEGNDFVMFIGIPMFLATLMGLYWLYIQYQQQIDYSKLSLGKFVGIAGLNFLCMALIFLPVVGLALSTLDNPSNQTSAVMVIQVFLSMATFTSVLPFILRQYKIIEIVLVIFFGFIYSMVVGGLLAGIFNEAALGMYVINLLVFAAYVGHKFYHKTYNQNTKRLALFCLLMLPGLFPIILHLLGVYGSYETAYLAVNKGDGGFLGIKWMLTNIVAIILIYSLITRFMYQSMVAPMLRK
ncbi:hypothetical protein [Microscilla marina]|uniref:Membrane protein, putative n=1 Tax=Microscilla marina ATCC 23134 TaxID=313606 RepID=A1ZKX9_MICM2|nr:hypothetical protein [Microscilla marina]EAY28945.1 membrane protein, putative [Microscilla marina ATCC 23134]